MYAIGGINNNLYYSGPDENKLSLIDDCDNIEYLYMNKGNNLLLAASNDILYFIDPDSNKVISNIEITNVINPEPNIFNSMKYIFPYYEDSDYCILINWSVYLINLKTFKIERIIWDRSDYQENTYIYCVVLDSVNKKLYMQMMSDGVTQYEWGSRNELRDYITCLNFETEILDTIIKFPYEEAPGAKYLFSTDEFLISYEYNKNLIITIPKNNYMTKDSVSAENPFFHFKSFPMMGYSYLQDINTGDFYKFYPNSSKLELSTKMNLNFAYNTTFQKLESGDIYACIPISSDSVGLIVNLDESKIASEIPFSFLRYVYLMEDIK